jgi:hypothetical protein
VDPRPDQHPPGDGDQPDDTPGGVHQRTMLLLHRRHDLDPSAVHRFYELAGQAFVTVIDCDVDLLPERIPSSDVMAVAGIGAARLSAARFAVEHGLVHHEIDDDIDSDLFLAALHTDPTQRPVISVVIDGEEFGYGIEQLVIHCAAALDVVVDERHRWTDITGPVSVNVSARQPDSAWVTINDRQAVLLDASPPVSATTAVRLHGDGVIGIDERRAAVFGPIDTAITLPLRRLTWALPSR